MKFSGSFFLSCFIFFGTLLFPLNDAVCWNIIDNIFNKNNAKNNTKAIFDDNKNVFLENTFYFLPPVENGDFFESINDLSICKNKQVRKYIFLYLTDGRDFLNAAITRSNRYLKTVEDVFNNNKDIPKDISLLPLLESAFNPYAVSRSKAVGMWQFLKNTSRPLNLKVNNWVDERRDVEKSTIAAIRHLRCLYSTFGSWELALAAYNGGAGQVKRAMRKSKSKTFAQLHASGALKKETSEYVHRFAAMLILYKNQKFFDIETETVQTFQAESESIVFEYPVKINYVSKLTGIPIETLRLMNPELKQNITPLYENKYTLRIPKGCKEILEANISSLYEIKYSKLKKHIVKKGECISRIAVLYKTEVKKIVLINNLKSPEAIKPGLELYIPI